MLVGWGVSVVCWLLLGPSEILDFIFHRKRNTVTANLFIYIVDLLELFAPAKLCKIRALNESDSTPQ